MSARIDMSHEDELEQIRERHFEGLQDRVNHREILFAQIAADNARDTMREALHWIDEGAPSRARECLIEALNNQ